VKFLILHLFCNFILWLEIDVTCCMSHGKNFRLHCFSIVSLSYGPYFVTIGQYCTRDGAEIMPPVFFSENVIAITMKVTLMIHTPFATMRLFFHKVCIIFCTLLPMLSKILYTSVVKFPALTS
jgi:hypothetical protein